MEFIKTLDSYKLRTHSIIMAWGDKIFAECYYAPFHKDFTHRMYSVSKSFVAVAVGLAEQDGLLSLDGRFMACFPEYRNENVNERYDEATIRDMLCMRTFMADYGVWWGGDDRTVSYFSKPSRQIPGTNFLYDSSGAFALGCLVEKVVGMPFLEYLKQKVLLDIGFSKASYSLLALGGHSHGDSGVMCTARDLLIFARLIMNKGEYNGKQYINREFLEAATSKQVDTNVGDVFGAYNSYGYGYFIWKALRNGFALIGMGYNEFSKFPGKRRMSITASVYEDGAYDCAASAVWRDNRLNIMAQIIDTYMGTLNIELGFKDSRVSIGMHRHAQRILDEYNGYAVASKL